MTFWLHAWGHPEDNIEKASNKLGQLFYASVSDSETLGQIAMFWEVHTKSLGLCWAVALGNLERMLAFPAQEFLHESWGECLRGVF